MTAIPPVPPSPIMEDWQIVRSGFCAFAVAFIIITALIIWRISKQQ